VTYSNPFDDQLGTILPVLGAMHQKSLLFCLSFAVSSLIFYICFYSNVGGAEHFQPQSALLNVRNVSYNSTNQDKEVIAGQNIDRGLANVSRVQDNLYDVQNETLGVRLEVCLSTESLPS
jgi:hypothetical protein